ncbi:MAG: hypothetical protein BA871_13445 [Desulfuromonadales bacterium C00003096]|nr:MAG: hypothetical protein BA871_13445 [Desulfuromonadales bacterium C00003096]
MTISELAFGTGVVILDIVQRPDTMALFTLSDIEQIFIRIAVAHIALEAQIAKIMVRIRITINRWYRCGVGFMTCLTATPFLAGRIVQCSKAGIRSYQ